MKRWIWRALLFLLIGAVINIAVAWGCVLLGPMLSAGDTFEGADWSLYFHKAASKHTAGGFRVRASRDRHVGCEFRQYAVWEKVDVFDNASQLTRRVSLPLAIGTVCSAGFPFRALEGTTPVHGSMTVQGRGRETFMQQAGAREHPSAFPIAGYTLPIWPRWNGVVMNTLAYALLVSLLTFIPVHVRRHLRRQRSLCEHCGYPVSTSPLCTECGKPVKPRTAAPA